MNGQTKSKPNRGHGTDLIGQVADWLMSQALEDSDFETLFGGCCERMRAAGVPITRGHVAFRILHPLYDAMGLTWESDKGVVTDRFAHREGDEYDEAFQRSPLYYLMTHDVPFLRRRLTGPNALVDFPVLEDLREQGATDYYSFILTFGGDDLDGLIGSWATDKPRGFSDGDIRALQRIQRRLGVAFKMRIKDDIARSVVTTYLGPEAGLRVLNGQIRRGDGEAIRAVIWYSDLRDSTPLADRLPPDEYIRALNDYFESTGGAVVRHGGQILNFIGDAVLAIFPIRRGVTVRRACRKALRAVEDASKLAEAVNRRRRGEGRTPLSYGLALHLGNVHFGNIGVPERISFSVIGSTVNEVARLESLTKKLKRTVLASESFVAETDARWDDLGRHRVKGVKAPMHVYGLAAEGR